MEAAVGLNQIGGLQGRFGIEASDYQREVFFFVDVSC